MSIEITMETICFPSENVVGRVIEGEIIIVPLVAGIGDAEDELYTLNATGQLIWQKLDGAKRLSHVAAELAEEFSCPASEIQSDVLGFVTEMVKRGILEIKT